MAAGSHDENFRRDLYSCKTVCLFKNHLKNRSMIPCASHAASPAPNHAANGHEKSRCVGSGFFVVRIRGSDHLHVPGLQALLALLDLELHALVLGQGLEPIALDFAEVHEQIGAAAILGDETETLAFIEPLHGALTGHDASFYRVMIVPGRRAPTGAETHKTIT
jgi:hypothetical protein